MKVVLLQDIKKLGDANDVVEVKPGYARNYLFRQGLAVPATPAELNRIKTQSMAIQAEKARKLASAKDAGEQLEGRTYEITMTVGDEGRLYGSLTPMMVAKVIAEDGFDVDHRDVSLAEVLRTVGSTKATVRLHSDVTAVVTVIVKGENGEETAPDTSTEVESPAVADVPAEEVASEAANDNTTEDSVAEA